MGIAHEHNVNSKAPTLLLFMLIALHLVAVFFPSSPSIFPNSLELLSAYNQTLSSYVSPILVVIITVLTFFQSPQGSLEEIRRNQHFLYAGITVFLAMAASIVLNRANELKAVFASLNFLLVNFFFLIVLLRHQFIKIGLWLKWFLFGWLTLPLLVIFFPLLQGHVIFYPCVLHGFSDSRLVYGFWCGVCMIIFADEISRQPRQVMSKIVLCGALIWGVVLLSQTRSVFVALAASTLALIVITGDKKSLATDLSKGAIGLLVAGLIIVGIWDSSCVNGVNGAQVAQTTQATTTTTPATANQEVYVRAGFFNVRDSLRDEIYARYKAKIREHWFVGCGGMCTVNIPEYQQSGVQAHNVFLQIWVNYGLVTLLAFVFWLVAFFRTLHASLTKMLLVYLVVFSSFQPMLGGSTNIFAPQVMLVFILILLLDRQIEDDKKLQFRLIA